MTYITYVDSLTHATYCAAFITFIEEKWRGTPLKQPRECDYTAAETVARRKPIGLGYSYAPPRPMWNQAAGPVPIDPP